MTNDIFQKELVKYQAYLKPQLYDVLIMVGDVFTNEARKEIIDELDKAGQKMTRLADYQEKREGILEKSLEKLKTIYQKVKAGFQQQVQDEENLDKKQAEEIIANL